MIIPSTTITVLRTNEASPPVDAWEDATESDTVAASGLPASIEEQTKRKSDPGSGSVTMVEGFRVSLRPRAFDFATADRIRDERTGLVYQVETVGSSTPGLMQSCIRLFCTRVS